jgi:hypothetical protein
MIRFIVGLTLIGIPVGLGFCAFMAIMFLFGFGEPNVIPEEGETYIGWWCMMFAVTAGAFPLSGLCIAAIAAVHNLLRFGSLTPPAWDDYWIG